METISFLDKVANELAVNHKHQFNSVVVVVPNKRVRLFLLESLKRTSNKTFFAPEIISIEDLIAEIAKVYVLNNVELLLEFYEVYKSVTPVVEQHDFEQFSNWAKLLLQDFNEIDRYLLNPKYVFDYLKNIDDINHWSVRTEDRSKLVENYITFWELLPTYYNAFNKHLEQLGVGYQGMVYRLAVDRLDVFLSQNEHLKYYFAGFNALNQAEEKIIQVLLKNGMAEVFWDTDNHFLNDMDHGAGYFARRIKHNWSYYKSHPYQWIVDEFKQNKQIKIISTPKSVGQAKIVGTIVEDILKQSGNLQKTAIVLADENLLIPVLYALPQEVSSLNITMGYDSKSNPVQQLFSKLVKMQSNALTRGKNKCVYYHKEVIDVLTNPLIEGVVHTKQVVAEINKRNLTFFNFEYIQENINDNNILHLILKPWTDEVDAIMDRVEQIVFEIRKYLREIKDEISLTFLYAFHQVWNQLKTYQTKYNVIQSIQQLQTIYKQIADMAEVSFEGEPLEGLQVMGVLESRVLDFDTVIITSLNEGKLPAGKNNTSFIPFDVKMELGLPTYKEKDAIYTYHFYHLLMRAKNVFLLYNSDSEGLDSGEKSRFITQLQLDTHPNHLVETRSYFAKSPDVSSDLLFIEKSNMLLDRLREIATNKGFSPSAIGNYMRNPMQFYMQRILSIREVEEVEENIALNTLGTIIHAVLEELYKPAINKKLTVDLVDNMIMYYEKELHKQFQLHYATQEERQGKNLLAFEVAKRNVYHFLKLEKEQLLKGDEIEIVALEKQVQTVLTDKRLPYPVKISGIVDRVEVRNGVLRIIDYKTGKVEQNQVRIDEVAGITSEIKYEKAIQLLSYGLMYQNEEDLPVQVGIYSFKNRKDGYLMFKVKSNKSAETFITADLLLSFKEELINLLCEILNPQTQFVENKN